MFGGASDLYKNRFHTALDQLDYDKDDYVYYPDVIRRRWIWHQPIGGPTFSGSDIPAISGQSGASQVLKFRIANNTVTDPTSYRLYFKCYVGDADGNGGVSACKTALANYAHSVFSQLTVRMTGSSSSVIEQVPSYNIFCSMLYQFYSTNYVQKFHATLEGYSTTNSQRVWYGRSFMLPLNVGFFMNLRKYIPNFCLPFLEIDFLMETCARATCQETPGTATGATPYYYINNCQLINSEVEVTTQFVDEMRERIAIKDATGQRVRLDFTSWASMSFQVAGGTTGLFKYLVAGNFVGLRKIMFGQINNTFNDAQTSASGNGLDRINSFSQSGLGSYRIQIGGKYFPDQDIYINNSGTTSTTALTTDVAQAAFFNMYAMGCQNNNWSDIIQNWGPAESFGIGGDNPGYNRDNDYVFLLSTEFDDSGLPILIDNINSGPLSLVLNYTLAVPTGGVTVYMFVNYHQAIEIYPGNRATIIQG